MRGCVPEILFFAAFLLCGFQEAVAGNNLRADVEFLSDSLCSGRASGTRGAVEASWYIERRMRQNVPDTRIQTFVLPAEGDKGCVACHNVLSEICRPGASRWLVITAYFDGLGTIRDVMYPGADSNASGVAALLAIADSLSSGASRISGKYNILLAALDGHFADSEGAAALWNETLNSRNVRIAVNLDIIGSSLSPVQPYRKEYVMALGAAPYCETLDALAREKRLAIYYDYYGSRDFTDLFFKRMGDQKVFLRHGIPSVMFTSGITMHTNKTSDTAETLDYDQLERRVSLILSWLGKL